MSNYIFVHEDVCEQARIEHPISISTSLSKEELTGPFIPEWRDVLNKASP